MITKTEKILILLVVCYLPHQQLLSQHISRDNYKGFWEDSLTWDPAWSDPKTIISGYDITINGYVTAGSLGFYNWTTQLIINDTLVIKGNLYLNNNNDLIINDNGVLIIRGNIAIDEHSHITANGYLIVTGNIYKENYRHFGSFNSNDNPPGVFIGGSVFPEEITDNYLNYPVLNCSSPVTNPYPGSGCSSGNMNDLMHDPIYPFFQSTCNFDLTTRYISVCSGDSIRLTASGGTDYTWNGPDNFNSHMQNPYIADADGNMSGAYTVNITAPYACESTDTIRVSVNPLPEVSITSSKDTLCVDDQRTLTGSPAGGTFIIENGPGLLTNNILKATDRGEIYLKYIYSAVCSNTFRQTIISKPVPYADAGNDQELMYHFETKLDGSLQPFENGTWSLLSGTGQIEEIHSPDTKVTGLSLEENVFLWTVSNGACQSGSQVKVAVLDLVVPSVFTPNDDGINDHFNTGDGSDPFEITIFNQWGIVEFESNSYVNAWDGKNNRGNMLPPETYFYILKFKNGQTRKGTVLIVR